jgi:hypothetical protein
MVPCRSGLEAGVRFAVIEQVTDAVYRVLEQGGSGENDHTHLGVHERDRSKSGDESGEFPGKAEVFERFHGAWRTVSTRDGKMRLIFPATFARTSL